MFARFRVLWSFTRPHTATLVIGLLLALAGSAVGLATPMVTKWVIDSLSGPASLSGPVLALLGLLVAGTGIWLIQHRMLGRLGERVVLEARQAMVLRLFRATVPAVTRQPVGELVARVTSDPVLLREAVSGSVIGLINGVVMLVGTLVLMAVLDPVLFATTLAAVLAVIILFAVLMPAIARSQENAQREVARLGGILEGALRAIRTVKASRAEERQAELVLRHARSAYEHNVRAVHREAVAWTISWSGIQLAIILVLGIGAWRVGEGRLEVSSLIAFLLYAFALMEPVTELSQNMSDLQAGIAAAGGIRAMDALEAEPGNASADRGTPDRARPALLELRQVAASHGPGLVPAVRSIDLEIPRRGHTAIVGLSGAGKTTLFSLILGFLRPQEGSLLLDGRPYEEFTPHEVRGRIAYVEQEAPVVPGTIRDNLRYSHPDASENELRDALRAVGLEAKVDSLEHGLDSPVSSTSVSGGERQRIALARAILRTPDLLLLDEATAQIDALSEAAVHTVIRERSRRGAVVTIAHRLSTVIDADTIVVMEAGRIRARGTHESLLASDGLYRELIGALRITSARGDRPAATTHR